MENIQEKTNNNRMASLTDKELAQVAGGENIRGDIPCPQGNEEKGKYCFEATNDSVYHHTK